MSEENNESKLLEIFETLNNERQNSLIDYASFLQSKGDLAIKEVVAKVDIERPATETVVGAIKRLKLTYPMIESMSIFSAASSLMTEHMVNGRDSVEVINEMQVLFEEFYTEIIESNK